MDEKTQKDQLGNNLPKQKLLNARAITMSGGNKGGTGKSTGARVMVEGYLELGIKPSIFEADGGNSDVAKFFGVKKRNAADYCRYTRFIRR